MDVIQSSIVTSITTPVSYPNSKPMLNNQDHCRFCESEDMKSNIPRVNSLRS